MDTVRDDIFRGDREKDPETRLAFFSQALAPEPDNFDILTRKGLALQSPDRVEEALTCHERATVLAPAHPVGWICKGNDLFRHQKEPDDFECYDRALRMNICDDHVLSKLVRYDQAIGCCDPTLAFNPTYGEALANNRLILIFADSAEEEIGFPDKSVQGMAGSLIP